jgi:hypothetical protein
MVDTTLASRLGQLAGMKPSHMGQQIPASATAAVSAALHHTPSNSQPPYHYGQKPKHKVHDAGR